MHRDGPLRLSIDLFCPHQDKVARRRVRLRFSPSRILAHDGKSAVIPDFTNGGVIVNLGPKTVAF
jgi:hypothetical protein